MFFFDFFKQVAWKVMPVDDEVKTELRREKSDDGTVALADEVHLKETAQWLLRAQAGSDDDGVSRAYRAISSFGYGPKEWQPSYPETTGYIIPTMFALAEYFPDKTFRDSAFRMADWECDIQMSSGAVMGSVVTATPTPAVFNTGQVIFGWLAAYEQQKEVKYLWAAEKAGEFLVDVQESDGAWSTGDSTYALKGATTYNARVAWALAELGKVTGDKKYNEAACRNIDLVLSRQQENGWFADNCLNNPEKPLLHTIVYATRGVLECGICLEKERYVEAAQKTLDALLACQHQDGRIPGRLKSDWSAGADWDCLTGDAQAAIAWQRLSAYCGDEKYMQAARTAVDFVKKTQNLDHENLGIRGGVKGSFPFNGEYGQYLLLNWAAKFFCDALLLLNNAELRKQGIGG